MSSTDPALADSTRDTSGESRSSESEEWEPVSAARATTTTNLDKPDSSPRVGGPWTLSPRIVYHNLRAGRSFSNLLHPDPDMISTSTVPLADARSPSSTRQAILGFMGRRTRSATTGAPPTVNPTSPSPPLPLPNLPTNPSLGLSGVDHQSTGHLHLHLPSLHRNPPATDEAPPTTGGRLGGILRRRRSNGGDVSPQETPAPTTPSAALRSPSARPTPPSRGQALPTRSDFSSNTPREPIPAGPTHRLRLVPHLDPSARTLHFEPIIRDVRSGGTVLRIGRFTDKVGMAARQPESNKIAFRSKVVSRAHAEIWCAPNGKFMIRDTRSSSGTFLNHTRLSAPNIESRPNELHDGDIVQLGVDYQGGNEEIYRCVKMRVEVGREWQLEANEFNTGALKQLQTLQGGQSSKDKGKARVSGASAIAGPSNSRKTSVADCCICLFPVAILQSLFIAPCSHCFHYKCIRPLLVKTFADLEEDVEKDQAPSLYAPSVREPSVYAASVYEVEAACNLIETAAATAITGRQCVDVCVGTSPAHSPSLHAKALPPVPTERQSTGDTEGSDRIRPGSTHSGPPHHSDGGSTPRGSSEDLRAAQRNMFDTTLVAEEPEDGLVRVPGGIIIPRTPDREQDMFNSATPLNNQFLTLAVLNGIGSGLPSIPSAGDIQALRRTSEDESSIDLAPYRTGDTESAKFILVDAEDVEDDDEALVIAGVKRMSTTETEGAPSSQI